MRWQDLANKQRKVADDSKVYYVNGVEAKVQQDTPQQVGVLFSTDKQSDTQPQNAVNSVKAPTLECVVCSNPTPRTNSAWKHWGSMCSSIMGNPKRFKLQEVLVSR